ncbi:MAG: ATP phosphoribosyltransferase regulatory subunit [Lachnospiraceae bacterium]|nr:ATP phosphoribosyltransferase regulatory subunit [Lachnospiraceae bacterium]
MTQPEILTKSEETIVSDLRRLFRQYGYRQYKMSKFEEYDLYVENKRFLVSDNVITFTDLDGHLRALKPDVTLSIAKNASVDTSTAQKLYYHENVYRAERGSHEYREIMQIGLESIGNIDLYATGEAVMLAAGSLKTISPDYLLDLSHMGVITAMLEEADLSSAEQSRLLDALSAKNVPGIHECCSAFGLTDEFVDRLSALTALYGPALSILPKLKDLSPNAQADEAIAELEAVCQMLEAAGCGERINLDFSIVNDMSYYNSIIFQGYIEGIPTPVLSGGRYDNLMKKFGKDAGAVGFAIYLSALESLAPRRSPYDVDALLLYSPDTAPTKLAAAVRELTEEGLTLQVQQAIPQNLRYRKLLKLTEGGPVTLEEND